MFSLKLRRGPPIQRAFAGLVFGLFGILWMLIALQSSLDFGWPVAALLGSLGVLITAWYWGQAAYYLIHAASQQRYAEDEHLPEAPPRDVEPARRCQKCRAHLEISFRYCPQCGTKV